MRRYSFTVRRTVLALACTVLASVAVVASSPAAVLVQSGSGTKYGVRLVPGSSLGSTNYTQWNASGGAQCYDPGLSPDLGNTLLPAGALCLQDSNKADGSTVLQHYETFAMTWDPGRAYWQTTRGYLEQFLRDVADGSNSLSSPFAVTTQYTDALGDRALNASVYGGGCIDYGPPAGYTCNSSNTNSGGADNDVYPSGDPVKNCPVLSQDVCLTDAAIKQEVATMVSNTHLTPKPGYTPLIVMLTPPGVDVCLDSTGEVCSATVSETAAAQFCSYHSQVNGIPYVVQPWTTAADVGGVLNSPCVEPKLPKLPDNPTPEQLETRAGVELVSPLSGGENAAIVNPFLNGWYSNTGDEIDDACQGGGPDLDTVPVGSGSYILQREFNNAATLESDPYTYGGCAPDVILSPSFVVPSAVDQGDTVEFDGSTSPSTLIVPNAQYLWNFGDGTTATGPSSQHTYGSAGNFTVTLTVTDRGNNTATLSQVVQVLGSNGQPVPVPVNGGSGSGGSGSGLQVHLQLQPQSLKTVLHNGIAVRVTSNKAANGIATVSITRASAKKAGIHVGHNPSVRIGLGTVSSITNGTATLRLHLSPKMAKKLSRLHHVVMTIRLSLVASGGQRFSVDVAGRY
jgi:PKD repeat protein